MSEPLAIQLTDVGKRYTLYKSKVDKALNAFGLTNLFPRRQRKLDQFWALRNVNLTLPRGAKVGIVGRNGAGKSTLLKLLTGNIAPTEGTVVVNGEVQALLQTGTGLHPEFTGYENIHAALTLQGFTAAEVAAAVEDIKEFTELGPHLEQPYRTYSTGMQARLAFATATMVKPEILIIDEVLGVGDGYFLNKSLERIQRLIDSGATVLLVSHAMDQIVKFCDRGIWLDRGQIVCEGDVLDVVKEYSQYLRMLDERRLMTRNQRGQAGGATELADVFTDSLTVRFTVPPQNPAFAISSLTLLENDRPQETLHVGGPQDQLSPVASGIVAGPGHAWTEPSRSDQRAMRSLPGGTQGEVVWRLFAFDARVNYSIDIQYQFAQGTITAELLHQDTVVATQTLAASTSWTKHRLETGSHGSDTKGAKSNPLTTQWHRWPGKGDLQIIHVAMRDDSQREQVTFTHGGLFEVTVTIRALADGTFTFRPHISIFRRGDGILVSQLLGDPVTRTVQTGDHLEAQLRVAPLLLDNGIYVYSVALFKDVDLTAVVAPTRYDLLDRAFEFQVHGRAAFYRGVYLQAHQWTVQTPEPGATSP